MRRVAAFVPNTTKDGDPLDEVYRGYRITVTEAGAWSARITHARGPVMPLRATATLTEGPGACMVGARTVVDRYIAFLGEERTEEPD